MTTENTYNGWTNWETWTVNMYLDGAIEAESLAATHTPMGKCSARLWKSVLSLTLQKV